MPYKDSQSLAAKKSQSKRNKTYYGKNKKEILKYKKEWVKKYYPANKEKYKKYWWNRQKKVYGIGLDDYKRILKEQGGRCAICGCLEKEKQTLLHIDHDHKTGKFRGLLCYNCNAGLGNFKDNKISLRKALNYLMQRGAEEDRILKSS